MSVTHPANRTQRPKPFVFFDLGETIVDLTDTVRVLTRLLVERFPSAAETWAPIMAKEWFVGLAKSMPRDDSQPFETQYNIGARVLAGLLSARGISANQEVAGVVLRRAWDEWQERARLCEGVTKEWLVEIRALSAGVGAVTDGDERDVRRLLTKTGLNEYFDSVTTSEEVRAYKPSPRIYRVALDALDAEPARSIFVSDSPLDLQGAQAIGMGCAWLRGSMKRVVESLPTGAIQLSQPRDLNPVLVRFQESGRFESG